ncbi:MAG: NnrS family protein [Gammaproteobacteria bacterium]|nr:NnrS family protein [Gammaproteobacteria bacterium]
MQIVNLDILKEPRRETLSVLAIGFRPFFLMGGISAIVLMLLWIGAYALGMPISSHYDLMQWHAHEMLFGFTVAVVSAFILTAPANWTGLPMPSGWPLGGMVLLWLAGRIIPFFPAHVPAWCLALVDIAFLPVLAAIVFRIVWKVRQWRNFVFPVLLGCMAVANGLAHARIRLSSGEAAGTELMLYLVLLLIVFIAGRVIPFFVGARLKGVTPRIYRWVEVLSIGSLVLLILADLCGVPSRWVAIICLCTAASHLVRLMGWHTSGVWRVPFLWILFLAYGWLVVGLVLKACAEWGWANPFVAKHAFTAGAIGVMIMGMMCRVTLGHTGRPMRASAGTISAFVLVNLSAVIRVVFPVFAPSGYVLWLKLSGAAWAGAFLIYLIVHGPMLLKPRADGRPG